MKKIIKNINLIMIIILIFLATLLIGTPIYQNNAFLVCIVSSIYTVIYFIVKIIKKEKVISTPIDILMCILTFSTLIPLVARTYVSLSGTIHGILRYFCMFNIFLVAKNECKKNPKNISILINAIIISILMLCIIGIDEINGNYLRGFKKIIRFQHVQYDEIRICSLFAYPNAMALVAGLGAFLAVGNIFKCKNKKIKIIYFIISVIFCITMLLTYSRLVYIIFGITAIAYILTLLIINKKINIKVTGLLILIAIVMLTYVVIGLNISEKLKVKNEYQKIFYSVESDKDYTFSFDLKSISDNKDTFIIKLTEKNKFFDDVNTTEIKFGSYEGIKKIDLHTNESTQVIYLNVKCEDENASLIINNTYLNDKQVILKYKILPTKVVEKVSGITFNNKSVWERLTFICDALKIIKNNWAFGIGGNSWATAQQETQSYKYFATEVHCFPVQILLENGILSAIAYIGISIIVLNKIIGELKNKTPNNANISYIVGFIFLQLHSLLDFGMSFLYVHLIVAVLIAIIDSNSTDSTDIKNSKFSILNIIICVLLIIISAITAYAFSVEYYYKKDIKGLKISSTRTEMDIFDDYYKLLPFNKDIKERRYKTLKREKNKDYSKAKEVLKNLILTEKYDTPILNLEYVYDYIEACIEDKNNIDNNVEFALDYVYDTEKFSKYSISVQTTRLENLKRIITLLTEKNFKEYAEIFEKQLKEEILEKEQFILDYENSRYKKENVAKYKEFIQRLK